jgi:hypothetical protein
MSSIQVRDRLTKEQHERRQHNARVLERVDRDNARMKAEAAQKQSDLIQDSSRYFGKMIQQEASGEAVRHGSRMGDAIRAYKRQAGLSVDD